MQPPIRWGILGTGKIARQFALGLQQLADAKLVAVGSRSAAGSAEFNASIPVPNRYASYESLVRDPEVDVVYIATPHAAHKEKTLLALAAGKAVLCEKPFAINAREAEAMIRFTRSQKLFLMEAMWTRFFPLMDRLRELLASKAIGEVRTLTADFGFRAEYHEEPRLFDRHAGGGALLDVGVYPVALASQLFGTPTHIVSHAELGKTEVDETAAMILRHAKGELAMLSTAIRVDTAQEAILSGTHGRIRIHRPWWRPTAMTLSREDQPDQLMEFPLIGNGYQFEAQEVMTCLRAGKLESDRMPLDETLAIMKTLDTLRQQWGLKYPMD